VTFSTEPMLPTKCGHPLRTRVGPARSITGKTQYSTFNLGKEEQLQNMFMPTHIRVDLDRHCQTNGNSGTSHPPNVLFLQPYRSSQQIVKAKVRRTSSHLHIATPAQTCKSYNKCTLQSSRKSAKIHISLRSLGLQLESMISLHKPRNVEYLQPLSQVLS
jgi:hypothetical protein